MAKLLTYEERRARKLERQIGGLVYTAVRLVMEHDYKRGCDRGMVAADRDIYQQDLSPIVRRLVGSGMDHIHVPRAAASEYIRQCEAEDFEFFNPVEEEPAACPSCGQQPAFGF